MSANLAFGGLVTVFGGSGFVGRYAVQRLARRGWRIRAAVRRPDLAGHLQPMGRLGQIHAVQANVRYPESVANAVRINGCGQCRRHSEPHGEADVHCRARTALAPSPGLRARPGPSASSTSPPSGPIPKQFSICPHRAESEQAVLEEFPAIIIRPSSCSARTTSSTERSHGSLRTDTAADRRGRTRFQPVYAGDSSASLTPSKVQAHRVRSTRPVARRSSRSASCWTRPRNGSIKTAPTFRSRSGWQASSHC